MGVVEILMTDDSNAAAVTMRTSIGLNPRETIKRDDAIMEVLGRTSIDAPWVGGFVE